MTSSTFKLQTFSLPLKALAGFALQPFVSGMQMLPNGNLLLGAAFSNPCLLRVDTSVAGAPKIEDLKLEAELGSNLLGVTGGFHESTLGDVDIVALHDGSLPGFVKGIFSKSFKNISTLADLFKYLQSQESSFSWFSSHSLLQWKENAKAFEVRRFQEPGFAWDASFQGDYVFGMLPGGLYREPYLHLNPEKRETLRNGLFANLRLHRSEDGTFWMQGENGRFLRFQYTEHKAKPTPLKVEGFDKNVPLSGALISDSASADGWLYFIHDQGKRLSRLRRNPASFEEEIQLLVNSQHPITALASVDRETDPLMVFAVQEGNTAKLKGLALERAEDPEPIPAVPAIQELGSFEGVGPVSSLTWDFTKGSGTTLWASEGVSFVERTNKETPRLLKFEV